MKSEHDYLYLVQRYIGWICIGLITAFPTIAWLFVGQLMWTVSWQVAFANIGKLLGVAGFMLFSLNMILSLRKRWLEQLFGGLNRTYIAHHLTGGIALIFICFHPLFLAINYINFTMLSSVKYAAEFLLPRGMHFEAAFSDVQQAVAINSGIIALVTLAGLLYITLYMKLPYRIWHFTHKFLGVSFAFAGVHVLFYNSALHQTPWLFWYVTLWFMLGIGSFVYHTVFGGLWIKREPYQVSAVTLEPANVVSISLTPVRKRIEFEAGQFIFIRFLWDDIRDGIPRETHPFSIASSPTDAGLTIHVKALGDYTGLLKKLSVGTMAEVEGAFGKFISAHFAGREQVWVAGGIGITPFLSMAHSYKETDPPVSLFYSVKTRSELIDDAYLGNVLPAQNTRFRYVPFVGDEQDGHLSADIIEQTVNGLNNKEIFLCGPPPMMASLKKQLKAKGVPGYLIHDEAFAIS